MQSNPKESTLTASQFFFFFKDKKCLSFDEVISKDCIEMCIYI